MARMVLTNEKDMGRGRRFSANLNPPALKRTGSEKKKHGYKRPRSRGVVAKLPERAPY